MVKKFTAAIDEFIKDSDEKMIAVVRQSTQEIVDLANLPVAKGGRMRVETGFLRASGQMSLDALPAGPIRGEKDASYDVDENSVITSLAGFELGQSIFYGWTAAYAAPRETLDGFLENATQNWPEIVAKNARKLR